MNILYIFYIIFWVYSVNHDLSPKAEHFKPRFLNPLQTNQYRFPSPLEKVAESRMRLRGRGEAKHY